MSHSAGFKRLARLGAARDSLLERVAPLERSRTITLEAADGRVLATPLESGRDVPQYASAAMDGFAVRAADTFGASRRSPAVLDLADAPRPDAAVQVHTGSEVPDGADAVVMVEHAERAGETIEVDSSVAEGENVSSVGEDVSAGEHLYDAGHRLGPADLGLLKSVGVREVETYDRPTVGVIPTGEELVQSDPLSGEVIETNGLTLSRYVERWGGAARYRGVVTDERGALRAAIERDLTADLVVTAGGSSVGERDLVPEVLEGLGELLVHGVGIKPGHPVGFGVVEGTPILMVPGYPVSCIVAAVQLLRPALKRAGHLPTESHPTTTARLDRKIRSDVGTRTFARVALDETGKDEPVAVPMRTGGAGSLSSVALADGWVVVPEGREGIPAGEEVNVEHWERLP